MKSITKMVLILAVLGCLLIPSGAEARSVRVGIGFAIPPYVIREKDAGLEVDIIRESFRAMEIEPVFVYLPNLRLPIAFASGEVDCVAVNAAYDLARDAERAVYDSVETVVFQNFAVSLDGFGLAVDSIEDLADKKVLAFANAGKYLGPEFKAMIRANPRYSELADQALQVRMLYSRRVDVVITDRRIFHYWRKQLVKSPVAQSVNLNQRVVFSAIFPPAPRHVAFREQGLRDLFDRGLSAIRESGLFDELVDRYVSVEHAGGL